MVCKLSTPRWITNYINNKRIIKAIIVKIFYLVKMDLNYIIISVNTVFHRTRE